MQCLQKVCDDRRRHHRLTNLQRHSGWAWQAAPRAQAVPVPGITGKERSQAWRPENRVSQLPGGKPAVIGRAPTTSTSAHNPETQGSGKVKLHPHLCLGWCWRWRRACIWGWPSTPPPGAGVPCLRFACGVLRLCELVPSAASCCCRYFSLRC